MANFAMFDVMLDQITPVILTSNEGPNIARTLEKLDWATTIVVVDSGSTDETPRILRSNPRVRLFERRFDSHPEQWRFAMEETGISTPWVLRLDADYQATPELISEVAALHPDGDICAYRVAFDYAVFSHILPASLYPPKFV